MTYTMKVAGLERQLPLCKVSDELYIGAFIMFGDAELTVACAKALLDAVPADSYDYMLTAEAKSIPLIHEMARQSGAEKYFIARKGSKVYMPDPIHVSVRSITTLRQQDLFLGADDCAQMKGKRILIVDDVISTGESLHALEELVRTRLTVLRAANGLSETEPLEAVERASREYYERALDAGEHTAWLIYDEYGGRRFIGAGGVSFYQVMPTRDVPDGRKAYIMNLYTAPEYRRQGIAGYTLKLLVDEARRRGISHISLEATEAGRPLYEKFGFRAMENEMELPEN